MLDKLFWEIASLKTSCSEKSVKYRSTRLETFFKMSVLKTFAIFTGKHPEGLQLYQKETPAQVFFCEYCETFLKCSWSGNSNSKSDLRLHNFREV